MKYLLHIDTSTDVGTVAIGGDGQLLASRTGGTTRDHASTINNMIDGVLADAGITLGDLSAIVVCGGPGSYTGLRIGMATAKGLCYALNKPLLSDNRLTLLAHQAFVLHKGYSKYISLLKARENEYFVTVHDQEFKCIVEPQHVHGDEIYEIFSGHKLFLISDFSDFASGKLQSDNIVTEKNTSIIVSQWVNYSWQRYNCNYTVNLATVEPFYLKQVYTHK